MITQYELNDAVQALGTTKVLQGQVLLLVPDEPDEVIDGDTAEVIEKEEKKMMTFFSVIKVADDVNYIFAGDRVYPQGQVTALNEEILPDELKDVAPDGYMLGMVHATYIKLIL